MEQKISQFDLDLAQTLWDYHALETPLRISDVLLVFGSNDLHVPRRAAEIYHAQLAPLIIVSGNIGRSSQNSSFGKTEAEIFAQIMIEQGIPSQDIILEKKATNTGENINFSIQLMKDLGYNWQKFILLQAPYMQRRAFSAFRHTQPEKTAYSTTVQIPFQNYLDNSLYQNQEQDSHPLTYRHLIEMLVADTQRLELYYQKGFLIKNDIPSQAWSAYEHLRDNGYNKYVISD